ncbi:MAG: SpoIIE family protein phosphatase [Bacteroidales bacterium]|nr:SpoIIE family protein phosphatase [Bacteroidales bacterium]
MLKKIFLILILIITNNVSIFAQNQNDTSLINEYILKANSVSNFDSVIIYSNKALDLLNKIKSTDTLKFLECYNVIMTNYMNINHDSALVYSDKILLISENSNNIDILKIQGNCFRLTACLNESKHDYSEMWSNFHKAIDIFKTNNLLLDLANLYMNIAWVSSSYYSNDNAIFYLQLADSIFMNDVNNSRKFLVKLSYAEALISKYILNDNNDSIILSKIDSLHKECYVVLEKEKAVINNQIIYDNYLASINTQYCIQLALQMIKNKDKEAIKKIDSLYPLCLEYWHDRNVVCGTLILKLIKVLNFEANNQILEAKKLFAECELLISKCYNSQTDYTTLYLIGICYEKLGNYQKANEIYKLRFKNITSNIDESIISQTADFKAQVKSEAQIQQIEAEKLIQKEKLAKNRILIICSILIIIALLVIVHYIANLSKSRKQANQKLSQLNSEILAQCDTISAQKASLEKAHNHINSSINYASRIQMSSLISEEDIKKIFDDVFVIFHPCSIVSGDFYIAGTIDEKPVFVTADCTGHGVPGGFLSMLGISFMKEIFLKSDVKTTPAMILTQLRDLLISTLASKVEGEENKLRDGMDVSICIYNKRENMLEYATANHTIYVCRNQKITRLKGDRIPVGRYIVEKEYSNFSYSLENDDIIYTMSDGFTDQPVYNSVGKYTKTRCINLLEKISNKSLCSQKEILEQEIKNTIGEGRQIDDITIAGVLF